jgi:hypothetical protein
MIAKRIKPKNGNKYTYRALALYVAGYTENNPGEKILYSWSAGCAADNFQETLMEIEAVQEMNTRVTKEKTYHLMLSFRPEDEEKLTEERMAEIESRIAQGLGYENHQRCCGVHKNTNNIHLHIAYNKISPETYNCHSPMNDYFTLSKVCREIERDYGLAVDPGIKQDREQVRTNTVAQTMEAHSGQESFDGYIQRNRQILLAGLDKAGNWQEAHKALAVYGIGVKAGNNGLVLYDVHGKHHAKASSLSRDTSRAAREKRFGEFEPAKHIQVTAERRCNMIRIGAVYIRITLRHWS